MSGSVLNDCYCGPHNYYFAKPLGCPCCIQEQEELIAKVGMTLTKPKLHNPLQTQVSGSHYKDLKIQPVEYIHGNGIPFIEGCVIKYVTRWRAKGGVEDLKKAQHFLDILIDLETSDAGK